MKRTKKLVKPSELKPGMLARHVGVLRHMPLIRFREVASVQRAVWGQTRVTFVDGDSNTWGGDPHFEVLVTS